MTYPLITPLLRIEPLSIRDLSDFVGYRQDPQIARYQSWNENYSKEQALELITSQVGITMPAAGEWLQLAIHKQPAGELLGDLALHNIEGVENVFEIGFTLAKEHQGQGFASEAVGRLVSYLFDECGATSITACCDVRNVASSKLLTASGFKLQPQKSWVEEFKGETVQVDVYALEQPVA
jgi:aminoglycoside 6'-N-acetyltransferase